MNQEERKQLKEEIKLEIINELQENPTKQSHRNKKLDDLREKYIDDLYKKFGPFFYWDVWDNIRKLSCFYNGIRYVRCINETNEEKVIETAEKLIKMALEEGE